MAGMISPKKAAVTLGALCAISMGAGKYSRHFADTINIPPPPANIQEEWNRFYNLTHPRSQEQAGIVTLGEQRVSPTKIERFNLDITNKPDGKAKLFYTFKADYDKATQSKKDWNNGADALYGSAIVLGLLGAYSVGVYFQNRKHIIRPDIDVATDLNPRMLATASRPADHGAPIP